MLPNGYMHSFGQYYMRIPVLVILLLASMQPMLAQPSYDEGGNPHFADAGSVDVIQEIEPNNLNTTGQEVYPGDVVRGAVDMWSDEFDYFGVWLEPGQTLLLTLSHAAGDGVTMISVIRVLQIRLANAVRQQGWNRLLPVIQVHEPANLPAHVRLVALVFKVSAQLHHLVRVFQLFLGQFPERF